MVIDYAKKGVTMDVDLQSFFCGLTSADQNSENWQGFLGCGFAPESSLTPWVLGRGPNMQDSLELIAASEDAPPSLSQSSVIMVIRVGIHILVAPLFIL